MQRLTRNLREPTSPLPFARELLRRKVLERKLSLARVEILPSRLPDSTTRKPKPIGRMRQKINLAADRMRQTIHHAAGTMMQMIYPAADRMT